MLDGLVNVLNGLTDFKWTAEGWTSAPSDMYGVISLDGQAELGTDANAVSEKMLKGYADAFYHKPKGTESFDAVEDSMRRFGLWFTLESVQYEDETGFVHYEWRWKDPLQKVNERLGVVVFTGDYVVNDTQILPIGGMPTPPTGVYYDDGVPFEVDSWSPPVTILPGKYAKYVGTGRARVDVVNGDALIDGQAPDEDQIAMVIGYFSGGDPVAVYENGVMYYATDVGDQGVMYDGRFVQWG